jgi:hypothetical protein
MMPNPFSNNSSKNKWSILILSGVVVGVVLCFGVVILGGTHRANSESVSDASPVLTIVALTTKIPSPVPTDTLEVTRVAGTRTPLLEAPTFKIGELVEIFGTEGDGLRVREEPGLTSKVIYLGIDNEVFEILDGPLTLDEYEWWLLQSPYNEARAGWAVGIFLKAIDS